MARRYCLLLALYHAFGYDYLVYHVVLKDMLFCLISSVFIFGESDIFWGESGNTCFGVLKRP